MARLLPSRAPLVLLVAVVFAGVANVAYGQPISGDSNGYYDPCQAPVSVKRGDSFVMGISYWAGYPINNWGTPYNSSTGVPGLNPCIGPVTDNGITVDYNEYLASKGAVLTSYVVAVDKLTVLRTSKVEMDQMWDIIPATRFPAISLIAFRGENRSEARYTYSNDPSLTNGVGIAQQMALVVNWNKGQLAGFEWFDFQQCAACGGIYSNECLRVPYDASFQKYPQVTCAAPFKTEDGTPDCSCRGLKCVSGNCTTAIYIAHRGTDSRGAVMQSASQLESLNELSVTGWFSQFWQKIDSAYDNSGSLVGNVGEGSAVNVDIPDANTPQGSF